MKGKELKQKLLELSISEAELAYMLKVSELTVWLWLDDRLPISSNVELIFQSEENSGNDNLLVTKLLNPKT